MTQLTQNDIQQGNKLAAGAYRHATKTFQFTGDRGAVVPIKNGFSNMISIGGQLMGMSSDGIGTKVEIAERMGRYHTMGFDLVAMIADDLVANGFDPLFLSNILDINGADPEIVAQLMSGLEAAATVAQMAITGGEIADLGDRISGYQEQFHFNWCGTGMGPLFSQLKEPITGLEIKSGDIIVALKEDGPRCNGLTRMRHILTEAYGDLWHLETFEGISWGERLLVPATIYAPMIRQLITEKIVPKGIVHITGGGIRENLKRILGEYQADLNHLFEIPPFFKQLIKLGDLTEDEGYDLWHMGQGMLLILAPEDISRWHSIMLTIGNKTAKIVGKVIQKKNPADGGL